VRYGNHIDRSSGVVLAGWWGLGILSLAQQLAPAGHQKGTRLLVNGVVTLTGQVISQSKRAQAEKIAAG